MPAARRCRQRPESRTPDIPTAKTMLKTMTESQKVQSTNGFCLLCALPQLSKHTDTKACCRLRTPLLCFRCGSTNPASSAAGAPTPKHSGDPGRDLPDHRPPPSSSWQPTVVTAAQTSRPLAVGCPGAALPAGGSAGTATRGTPRGCTSACTLPSCARPTAAPAQAVTRGARMSSTRGC